MRTDILFSNGIVYRGCAVPVAWKVLKAEENHTWKPEWQALLKRFQGLLAEGWAINVLADRGLSAKWLLEAIVELKWHPFLRVNSQGWFRPETGFTGSRFPVWRQPRAAIGRGAEPQLRPRKANCAARCCATGAKNIKILGCLRAGKP